MNTNTMSARFRSKQAKLRTTKIEDVGTYNRTLSIGDFQSMTFLESNNVPFYLDPEDQVRQKYNKETDKVKIINKTKKIVKRVETERIYGEKTLFKR